MGRGKRISSDINCFGTPQIEFGPKTRPYRFQLYGPSQLSITLVVEFQRHKWLALWLFSALKVSQFCVSKWFVEWKLIRLFWMHIFGVTRRNENRSRSYGSILDPKNEAWPIPCLEILCRAWTSAVIDCGAGPNFNDSSNTVLWPETTHIMISIQFTFLLLRCIIFIDLMSSSCKTEPRRKLASKLAKNTRSRFFLG